MGGSLVVQPNGLVARWSSVVDAFTNINMTKQDYIDLRTEHHVYTLQHEIESAARLYDRVVEGKAPYGAPDWEEALSSFELVHDTEFPNKELCEKEVKQAWGESELAGIAEAFKPVNSFEMLEISKKLNAILEIISLPIPEIDLEECRESIVVGPNDQVIWFNPKEAIPIIVKDDLNISPGISIRIADKPMTQSIEDCHDEALIINGAL